MVAVVIDALHDHRSFVCGIRVAKPVRHEEWSARSVREGMLTNHLQHANNGAPYSGMRIAFLSDIHGNHTALRAVVADLDRFAPDQVVIGGDLVGAGGRLADIVDLIHDRGWPCIAGNTDEMLWEPERIDALAARLPQMNKLWDMIRDDIRIARRALGKGRLAWLKGLPERWMNQGFAVVHASPGDKWTSPAADAPDDKFLAAYSSLARPVVVFGHLHIPFVRRIDALTIANSGSVGMPQDGDPRASYLIADGADVSIRRVGYDVEAEVRSRVAEGYPHSAWIGAILRSGTFQPP
jgi:putative phosphoesterase